ncbi:acyltransferase family protein [Rhodococcus zopfii]|uniref:acyltransferase family protein n=1 Tax=Rhodococcus zopfii TaxID=43772 RepID=UPI0011114E1F|nr:acyltransferase family protein [Rhodococcus zopfii]
MTRVAVGYEQFLSTKKFGALDGLRALSVVAVVWHHTSGTPGPPISQRGHLGVELFFAISGFLITTLLLREFRREDRISLRNFYARRSLRIFPLYYAVLAMYVVLVILTRRGEAAGSEFTDNLPAFATYTSNWFVDRSGGESVVFYFAWSLATEEQFYLLWPPVLVLALILGGKRMWPPMVALVVLIAVSQVALLFADGPALAWKIAASLSLPILLGALAAIVLDTPRGFVTASAVLGYRWSAAVVFALLVGVLLFDIPGQLPQFLMVLLVVAVSITEKTVLHPALGWRPIAFVGAISYGIYLLHMLCANVVRQALGDDFGVGVFAATLSLVVAAAYISFRWFERPILGLKSRFGSTPQRGVPTVDARQAEEQKRIGNRRGDTGRKGTTMNTERRLIRELDRDLLRRQARTAEPFPHILLDDFLDPDFAREVLRSWPSFSDARKVGKEFRSINERNKIQVTDSQLFPPALVELEQALASPEFLDAVSSIFGIPDLLPDAELVGGGLHQTGPRGRLDVHIDFNFIEDRKLHRRLNILIYFNEGWLPEWGGRLELWNSDVSRCVRSIEPVFNRCVIFETSEISYHGVTEVACPADTVRRSFAGYYYTEAAPAGWNGQLHSTVFKARPRESVKARVMALKHASDITKDKVRG